MTHWMVVAGALGTGAGLLLWCRQRFRDKPPIEDAIRLCPIGELEAGRFRVIGRVMAIESTPSLVDGTDCVYVERAEYRTVGSGYLPLLREVEHRAIAHPFYLEDESGRILVDPSEALIECATATADGGLTAERRLRAGEEVSLIATFRTADAELESGAGPYRACALQWHPIADMSGPPRLSHRTDDGMIRPPPHDAIAFLGGVGGILLALGTALAFALWFFT